MPEADLSIMKSFIVPQIAGPILTESWHRIDFTMICITEISFDLLRFQFYHPYNYQRGSYIIAIMSGLTAGHRDYVKLTITLAIYSRRWLYRSYESDIPLI